MVSYLKKRNHLLGTHPRGGWKLTTAKKNSVWYLVSLISTPSNHNIRLKVFTFFLTLLARSSNPETKILRFALNDNKKESFCKDFFYRNIILT